ncbi:MAG: hypothetical protein L6R38_005403 [Xanthoria sp. 2 TBL-2021]|nr:MAG: hypothetical protein L6R38_005403 [Xanthoria sp. 2 TBL-2021]
MAAHSFSIPFDPKPIPCILSNRPSSPHNTPNAPLQPFLIFTHGAGGTLASPAIANFSTGFSHQLPILCFQGNSNLGSRTKMFSTVISDQKAPTSLGGRSMGARAAVLAATEETKHLVLISYPLHTGDQVRDQILLNISPSVKVIFVSGDRDSMCHLTRLEDVRSRMKCQTWRIIVEGADHGMDMKPKKLTEAVGIKTGEVVAGWIQAKDDSRREGRVLCHEGGEVKWTGWEGAEEAMTDSPKAKQKTASDIAPTPKGTPSGKTSTKAMSTPKRRKTTTNGGNAGNETGSKRARRTTPAADNDGPNQDNVSGRTRSAGKARAA